MYQIIHEDHEILLVNKPATIPVQNDQTVDPSLLAQVEMDLGRRLYLVNRIDRPVSGLVLLAKSPIAQTKYSSLKILKRYIAISHKNGNLKPGTYEHYHIRNGRNNKAYISDVPTLKHKSVKLTIEEIHPLDNYDAIKLSIMSGRFHQIRAQLSHLDSPIMGDVKYGARRANRDRSIMLHSYEYEIPELGESFRCMPDLGHNLWNQAQLKLFN